MIRPRRRLTFGLRASDFQTPSTITTARRPTNRSSLLISAMELEAGSGRALSSYLLTAQSLTRAVGCYLLVKVQGVPGRSPCTQTQIGKSN